MRKICSLIIMCLVLWDTSAQCTSGFELFGVFNMSNNGIPEEVTNCSFYGDYKIIDAIIDGNDYEFASNQAAYFTVTSGDGATILAHGNAPLTYTNSNTGGTGVVRLYLHANASCDTGFVCNTITAQNLSVTPPEAPNCIATLNFPINGATDIEAIDTITLDWGAPSTGVEPTAYNIYIGSTSESLVLLTTIDASETTFSVAVGAYDTTRYWKVVPINGISEAQDCPVWSFTTEAPPLPPSNDDCANAVVLVPDDSSISGTTQSATQSQLGCTGTANDDVWYKFTAKSIYHDIQIENTGGNSFVTVQVFDASCTGTSIYCATASTIVSLPDLQPEREYVFRIHTWSGFSQSSFNVGVVTRQPPNDACTGAIPLTVGLAYEDHPIDGTVLEANLDSTTPECGANGPGVWYSVVVPDTSRLTIETGPDAATNDQGFDSVIEVFRGSCEGTLIYIACNDDIDYDNDIFFSKLELTDADVSAGEVLYIRVRELGGNGFEPFSISAYNPILNDDCTGAITLTVGTSYTDYPVDGTVKTATSTDEPTPSCHQGNNGPGVWYSVVVPSSGSLTLETGPDIATGNTGFDSVIEAFSGTSCSNLVSIGCNDNNESATEGNFSKLELTGQTSGEVLFIRVWEYDGDAFEPFSISAYDPIQNDDCTGAIALTVGSSYGDYPVDGTVKTATSTDEPTPSCHQGNNGPGVWYSVVVPSSGSLTLETGPDTATGNTDFDSVIEVFSGASCGSLVSVGCNDDDSAVAGSFSKLELTGQTPEEVLFIRVWEYDGDAFEPFSISAYDPITNDDCTGAIALTVGTSYTDYPVDGTVKTATSTDEPTPSCHQENNGPGVWYSVVVPSSGSLTLETGPDTATGNTDFDSVIEVFSGASCGSLVSVGCNDDDESATEGSFSKLELTGQPPGAVLYIRVWEYGGDAFEPFSISAYDPILNDDCTGAITLTVGTSYTDYPVDGTVKTATLTDEPIPSCQPENNGPGVWYSVVVPNSGKISIETGPDAATNNQGFDSVIEAFSGISCSNLVSLGCNDDNESATEGSFSKLELTGQTPGEVLFIRVWEYAGNAFEPFSISAYTPPDNDDCSSAIALTVGTSYADYPTDGTVKSATLADEPVPSCSSDNNGPGVWYSAIVPSSGSLTLETGPDTATGNTDFDSVIEVFSGASCESLVSVGCNDDDESATEGSFSKLELTGQPPGGVLYIRVWEYGGDAFEPFSISAYDPPLENDNCLGAITLTPSSDETCNSIVGTTVGATQSVSGCSGIANDDVWYKFVATSTSHDITVANTGGETFIVEVFDACEGNVITCEEIVNVSIALTDLTITTAYVFRIYTKTDTTAAAFDICITTPEPQFTIVNDICGGATTLTVGNTYFDNAIDALVTEATYTNDPIPACEDLQNGPGIWYSVEVPESGNINIETGPDIATVSTGFDSVIEVFNGTCETLSSLGCDDDSGDNFFSKIELTNQVPGTVLYIRVWESGGDDNEPFSIAAYEPLYNDTCSGASDIALGEEINGDTSNATNSISGSGSCGVGGPKKDLWYSFTPSESVEITVSTTADYVVIYDACNGNEVACVFGGDNISTGLVTDADTQYYLRVYNTGLTGRNAGTFTLTINDKALSTNDFIKNLDNITYYPNPVEQILHLNAKSTITRIDVYNVLGQKVIQLLPGTIDTQIDMSQLPQGAYFVKLETANTSETIRVVKQ